MENFIDISYLGTFAGTLAVTMILTQFFKELVDKYFSKIPTKYVSFVFALVTILAYEFVTGSFRVGKIYIILVNAIIVTLGANGGFEWLKGVIPPSTKATDKE